MGKRITVTKETICDHFKGILIECSDIGCDSYQVPGWECLHCGWRIGTSGLPPSHECDQQPSASGRSPLRTGDRSKPGVAAELIEKYGLMLYERVTSKPGERKTISPTMFHAILREYREAVLKDAWSEWQGRTPQP